MLGLVCGRRHPLVGCQLESHVSGLVMAPWVGHLRHSRSSFGCRVKAVSGGAGELAHLGSLPSVPVHVCMLSCPRHRVVVVVVPLVGHMVVPSPSCVSARWVGTNVAWGYLPWHPKYTMTMNDKCRSSIGCNIANSNVAPGCRVREVSGGGR